MIAVLVVRHARAEGNAHHRFIGQTDVPLSPEGRQQAELLAHRLSQAGVTRIISSDLGRCRDTVAPLADHAGLEVSVDRRLREIDNGEWSGLLPEEISAGWPRLWESYVGGHDVARPGGERWEDVRRRVGEAVEEITASLVDGEVLVLCTHGGPGLLAVERALGLELPGNIFTGVLGALANASISTIRYPGPKLAGFNDVGHLEVATPLVSDPYRPAPPAGDPGP
jgi:broad specificity phosphatase PhoE